eukprot:199675-Chlamydomonas_euryale.AAC.1
MGANVWRTQGYSGVALGRPSPIEVDSKAPGWTRNASRPTRGVSAPPHLSTEIYEIFQGRRAVRVLDGMTQGGSTLHANGMLGRAVGPHQGNLAGVCAFVRGIQTAQPSMEYDPK